MYQILKQLDLLQLSTCHNGCHANMHSSRFIGNIELTTR